VSRVGAVAPQIHRRLGPDPDPTGQWTPSADALIASSPNITMAFARRSIDDEWLDLRVMQRRACDLVRLVQPEYAGAPILRERARDRVPESIRTLADYEGVGH